MSHAFPLTFSLIFTTLITFEYIFKSNCKSALITKRKKTFWSDSVSYQNESRPKDRLACNYLLFIDTKNEKRNLSTLQMSLAACSSKFELSLQIVRINYQSILKYCRVAGKRTSGLTVTVFLTSGHNQ